MMNLSLIRKLGMIMVVALLLSVSQSAEGRYQEGLDAYKRKDFGTAFKELRPFAEQGDAVAQKNLGLMYTHGSDVPKDYKLAVKWFRKSAEQGNAGAQFNMGSIYGDGYGVPQDYELALKWFRKSRSRETRQRKKHSK